MRRTRLIALGAAGVTILVALSISAHIVGGKANRVQSGLNRFTTPIHREFYRPI